MDLKLGGKFALVSGSTQGIGRAIAEMFISEGARVIVNGRDPARLSATVSALSRHDKAYGVVADLSTAAGARTVVDAAADIGPVDILVNNVGYFEVRDFEKITDESWSA